MNITLSELEQAINYWRGRRPSTGEECALSPEVNALATIYALMIYEHRSALALAEIDDTARKLIEDWKAYRGG